MRNVFLYFAMSLDGKLARTNGDVSWLDAFEPPEGENYGYQRFIDKMDTVLMGRKTYEQITSFDVDYPYANKTSIVFTRNKNLKLDKNVRVVHESPEKVLEELRNIDGKNIWMIGGAELNNYFLSAGLVDELTVFVMPIVLGQGIDAFGIGELDKNLTLLNLKVYSNGVVEMRLKPK